MDFSKAWKMLRQKLVWLTLLFALLLPAFSLAQSFPTKWDSRFKESTDLFLPPGTDWRLLKAQCYQESRLVPYAVSPVGATGLCQFMPGTWKDVSGKLGYEAKHIWMPEYSILAAGYYMGYLMKNWSAPRPQMDRIMISMASYNAGLGNLLRAQRICDNQNLYVQIIPCLPEVTGRHSEETIDYVEKIIGRWWPRMLFQ